jgi:hypothetical protein
MEEAFGLFCKISPETIEIDKGRSYWSHSEPSYRVNLGELGVASKEVNEAMLLVQRDSFIYLFSIIYSKHSFPHSFNVSTPHLTASCTSCNSGMSL